VSDCAADGKTYKEAPANVEIIIQEWIETAKELGRPIPVRAAASPSRKSQRPHPENRRDAAPKGVFRN
jgi:predicted RNase H-like HicB family nuclease